MKKYLFVLPIIILPYILLFFIICVETGFLIEDYFDNFVFIPMLILILIYVFTIIYSIILSITNYTKNKKSSDILKVNMIIKIIHIPAYIVVFILGLGFMMSFFFPVALIFMFLDAVTIFCSGSIGLSGILNGKKEEKFSKNETIIYGILQFVFCLDVLFSIITYRRSKQLKAYSA